MFHSRKIAFGSLIGLGVVLGGGMWTQQPFAAAASHPKPSLESAISLPSISKQATKQGAFLRCRVVGIRTGQLALRHTPGGASRAGLNNGNIVDVYDQQDIWNYVQVVAGPNRQVTGLWGWVNRNYLACND
jgi:hypothetical protein